MLLAKQSPDFILEVAERLEPEVRRAFLRAVEALKKAIPVNQIADLLDDGKLTEALSSLSDVPLPDLTEIRDAIANAAIRTSESVAVEFGMSFELVNERAVRWAQNHAGNMITNVNRETVKAVRDIIVRGQREGLNVRNQAQLIRSVVGLTDRDARAVDRFYTGLLEDVSERQARRQRDIMANRLLRRRAENIARTETIRASNMGTQLGWEAAQDQGFLPQSAQKVWIATEDSRTCPICAVLDGEVIGMRDGFNVDRQAVSFTRDGDEFRVAETVPLKRPSIERTPPAHPSCRCTVGLEFAFDRFAQLAETSPQMAQAVEDMKAAIDTHPDGQEFLRRLDIANPTVSGTEQLEERGWAGVFRQEFNRVDIKTTVPKSWDARGELRNTLVHELTHAIDYSTSPRAGVIGRTAGERALHASGGAKIRSISRTVGHPFRDRFTYAASSHIEGIAELVALELVGAPRRTYGTTFSIPAMTAQQFRKEFPELSTVARRWMRGEFD